jgi:uncharacterized protein with NRDE domain
MCTVTFIPLKNKDFILTSNRDEQKTRETFFPKIYKEEGVELLYPKDKIAGGTWIGTSSKKRLVCVLNGGFVNHVKKMSYAKSRGVIAKELLKANNSKEYITQLNLENVEPFTMVIVDWNDVQLHLYELIWDDNQKHFTELKKQAKIWSSSTLYSESSKANREKWFQSWQKEQDISIENVLKFHHSELGDKTQSILMKRPAVETVSITSIKKEGDKVEMIYEDVISTSKKKIIV